MSKSAVAVVIIIVVIVLGGLVYLLNNKQHTSQTNQQTAAAITPEDSPIQANTTTTNNATVSGIASPSGSPVPTIAIVQNATQAVIHTVKGDITIKLYPQDAPKTVANFATLAQRHYYDGLTFHRVVPGFVIQGGDPNGDGSGGTSIYGPTFADELNPNTPSYQEGYKEGVVAMANRGPDTNGSQFFIMLADNDQLPHAYTIFGKVTTGLDVVHKIQVGDKMTSIDITTQ